MPLNEKAEIMWGNLKLKVKHAVTYVSVVLLTAVFVAAYFNYIKEDPVLIKENGRFAPMISPANELVILDKSTGKIDVYSDSILNTIYNMANAKRIALMQNVEAK